MFNENIKSNFVEYIVQLKSNLRELSHEGAVVHKALVVCLSHSVLRL